MRSSIAWPDGVGQPPSCAERESFDDAERQILQRRKIEVSQAMKSDRKMSSRCWDPDPVASLATVDVVAQRRRLAAPQRGPISPRGTGAT